MRRRVTDPVMRWVDGGAWQPDLGRDLAALLGRVAYREAEVVALLEQSGLTPGSLMPGVPWETQWFSLCERLHGQGGLGHLVDLVLDGNQGLEQLEKLVERPAEPVARLAPTAPVTDVPAMHSWWRSRRLTSVFQAELDRWRAVAASAQVTGDTAARLEAAGERAANLAVSSAVGRGLATVTAIVVGAGLLWTVARRCPADGSGAAAALALAACWLMLLVCYKVVLWAVRRAVGRTFSERETNCLAAAISATCSGLATLAVHRDCQAWVWAPWSAFRAGTSAWRQSSALVFGAFWLTDALLLTVAALLGVGALASWRGRRDPERAVAAPLVQALELLTCPGAGMPDARRRAAERVCRAASELERAVRATLRQTGDARVELIYEGCRRRADRLSGEATLLRISPGNHLDDIVVEMRELVLAVVAEDFAVIADTH